MATFAKLTLRNKKSLILRNPVVHDLLGARMAVGVEVTADGEPKVYRRKGRVIDETIQMISTDLIKHTKPLYMSKKYGWLVENEE